ncbi:MAG: aldo/keto reductase [Thaumarchaeota archaeon]|nr:MAG: aldo/keto reductase [Nitrososphaerota archaeon]
MKYRALGKSSIKVSEIGFGAWTIGLDWWGKKIDDAEAIKMLKRAYDLGINLYETADMYGKGKSERLMALKFALDKSLERLQTDYIDVYSLHNPKMDAIKNDALFAALDQLVTKGTIKSHGAALGPAIGWKDEGLEAIKNRNITSLQTVYNILEQDPGRDFLREGERHNVGIMVRVPDASGLLTGKVTADTKFDKNDHRSFRKQEFITEAIQKIENMGPIAKSKGWNITELAIKFILSQKQISVVLPTMISMEEIEMFASISDGKYLNPVEAASVELMYEKNFYVQPVASK